MIKHANPGFRQDQDGAAVEWLAEGVGGEAAPEQEHPGDGQGLQLRHVSGGGAEDQGDHLHALGGHPRRGAEARPPRPHRHPDALCYDRHPRRRLHQVPERPATSRRQICKSTTTSADYHKYCVGLCSVVSN